MLVKAFSSLNVVGDSALQRGTLLSAAAKVAMPGRWA